MKKFLALFILTSCQWIVSHPKEDVEILLSIEELAKEAYEYESKTLSLPSPQPHVNDDLPPFKPGYKP